jgi:Cdc6-like AAA superfamily ATPase
MKNKHTHTLIYLKISLVDTRPIPLSSHPSSIYVSGPHGSGKISTCLIRVEIMKSVKIKLINDYNFHFIRTPN